MKLKFKQRVILGYYKARIRTIGIVSPQKAASIAFDLFSTPFKSKSKRIIPPIFHKAIPISIQQNKLTIRGFRWESTQPNAKKILIVHGFSSYAYKFAKYVNALRKEGFEVLAFDAPAHGDSDGKKINALIYRDTILAIEEKFGPLYGIIAHSLGGLAASLAIELLSNQEKRKLVLIAPATETKTAVEHFFTLIPSDPKIVMAFNQHIEQIAQKPISYFSVARVARTATAKILWVHDQEDNVCTFNDVKPLLSEQIDRLELLITKGLGHNNIYKDNSTKDKIIQFLTSPS